MLQSKTRLLILVILVVSVFLLIGRLSIKPVTAVEGENLTTNVSVTNVGPRLGTITCSPISSGNFTPDVAANKTLSCWTVVIDDNGYGDINQSSFKSNLYNDTVGGADDLNTHYSNGTASNRATDCTWTNSSGTNITVNCSYAIRYFVTPSPGGWIVNFTVSDSVVNTNSTSLTIGVATTLGLDVINTTIEYGSVALGGEAQRTTNVTNTGNQQIDVKLRESLNSGNLNCNGVGSANIATDGGSTSGIKYNVSTITWPGGISLTSSSTSYTTFNLDYYAATGTTDGTSASNLYWRIKVPSTGVSGVCTGQTEIVAVAG